MNNQMQYSWQSIDNISLYSRYFANTSKFVFKSVIIHIKQGFKIIFLYGRGLCSVLLSGRLASEWRRLMAAGDALPRLPVYPCTLFCLLYRTPQFTTFHLICLGDLCTLVHSSAWSREPNSSLLFTWYRGRRAQGKYDILWLNESGNLASTHL